ncbi:hypothetical protein TrRE_jg11965 [Triparma retinervis]|uniref:PPPDE domain-containing protein n=1 Tax=Triparma retinervis TaxID=2557542 RepID=A0A9W7G3K7_9STRA|nr:hypothetical protein TrRE_jg11965 [Triparma retinervis]
MQSLLGTEVILHIYKLTIPDPPTVPSTSLEAPKKKSFISRLVSTVLPSIGMGAYHTSLDIGGYNYQYGSGIGISRGKLVGGRNEESLPPGCTYLKSLPLGFCSLDDQASLNSLINTLRGAAFHDQGYNVVTRNCNHFTTVLATAVCCADAIMRGDDFKGLGTYPPWVNRLARSGGAVGAGGVKGTGAEGGGCEDEVGEARDAVGKGKVKWSLPQRDGKTKGKTSTEKKVLTEKQKAMEQR